jgi:hypothetical protein
MADLLGLEKRRDTDALTGEGMPGRVGKKTST